MTNGGGEEEAMVFDMIKCPMVGPVPEMENTRGRRPINRKLWTQFWECWFRAPVRQQSENAKNAIRFVCQQFQEDWLCLLSMLSLYQL
jgi:hypothetical protein